MPGTFSQIYIQVIFAVQNRNALIHSDWEENMFRYITGLIQSKEQKLITINGTSDHIHIFIGLKPNCNLSDLVREIKKRSCEFIKVNNLTKNKFNWQEGYGAFSYSQSQINAVYNYIINQKEHHRKVTFKDEYVYFLKKFNIDFEERYLFTWL